MLDPLLTDLCVDVVDLEEDVDVAVEWAEEMGLTLVANVNLTDIVAAIDRKSLTFSIGFFNCSLQLKHILKFAFEFLYLDTIMLTQFC